MAASDDKLALWIAILLIAFSLLINIGIPAITGKTVVGTTTITLENLEQGITLYKGNNKIIIPETLIGTPADKLFASIQDNVRFVEMGYTSFQQGKKIWLVERPKYNKEIIKYKRDHYYSPIITSKEIKIKILGTPAVTWTYIE
ncbi:MAG: hypothetical protein Q7R56_00735 [Nanoarchaeota archaeon]|nr:hypothetical protein [Nanoarchaeota archaeon]